MFTPQKMSDAAGELLLTISCFVILGFVYVAGKLPFGAAFSLLLGVIAVVILACCCINTNCLQNVRSRHEVLNEFQGSLQERDWQRSHQQEVLNEFQRSLQERDWQRSHQQEVREWQRSHQQERPLSVEPSVHILNESRENRREHILTNILIHKKAIEEHPEVKSRPNSDDSDGEEEDTSCTLVLPPENDLSSRLNALLSDVEEGMIISKNDIYLESLRSIRDSLRIFPVAVTDEKLYRSSLYSPQTCPVCLEDYKKGDEIACSKNEKCPHSYHVDCILEWLMEHDDCPMCREQYVM